jgi:hypothetical protein
MPNCIGLALGLALLWCDMPQGQSVLVRCPPLRDYPADVQRAAARDLRRLGSSSAAAKLISDYGTLRERCRAITK